MPQFVAESATSFDTFSSAFWLPNVGAPFLIGLVVGYFSKKLLRLALLLAGAAVILLFIVEYYGIIRIYDQGIQQAALEAAEMANQGGGFLLERLSWITCKGVSAAAGFFVGLRMG